MFESRYNPPGTAPATLVPRGDRKPVVTYTEYDASMFQERPCQKVSEAIASRQVGKVSWIDLDGLAELEALQELGAAFGLHPLALEDVLNAPQRPKVEEFADHCFIVAQVPFWDPTEGVKFEQISFFLGKDFLVTMQENPLSDVFQAVRDRLRSGRGFGRSRGPDYLLYALLDSVVDRFFPMLESLGEALEELEDELLERPTKQNLVRLHEIKRWLMTIRRNIWPVRELFSTLLRDDSGLVHPETAPFLRDCHDHTIRLMDVIENYRDLTAGMMDIYLSGVGMRTNEVMRVLTVMSSIFIPLTFIAGLYGMNFESMPGLKNPAGFTFCVGSMLALAAIMLALFRSKKWI
jgi:magnesium transporter